MIWSGLPYTDEGLKEAYFEGAEVDLSKVNFKTCKTIEENYNAALVYLRNTDFNVKLHYENMNYTQKATLIKSYFNTKIKYDIKELDETLVAILFACAGSKKEELNSIMNDLELITFVADEFNFCMKLWTLVASLPVFAISRVETQVDMSSFEETDEEPNTVTLINMMKVPAFGDLYVIMDGIKPKFYKKLFTVENTELFEAMLPLPFMVVMHGLVNEEPEKFKEFLEGIADDRAE